MVGEELGSHGADVFRLVAIEASRADEALEFLLRNLGIVFRRAATLEKRARDEVHPLVGALGTEHRGDEEFQRVRVIQLAMGIGVNPREPFQQFFRAIGAGHVREIRVRIHTESRFHVGCRQLPRRCRRGPGEDLAALASIGGACFSESPIWTRRTFFLPRI